MEAHLQKKVNTYCSTFKHAIFGELDTIIANLNNLSNTDTDYAIKQLQELKMKATFIPYPEVDKVVFKKKKRLHNIVAENELCTALCFGGIRCSRRRQGGMVFCGTHIKGQPNGTLNGATSSNTTHYHNNGEPQNGKFAYPVNENGIIKIYTSDDKEATIDANVFMKAMNENNH